MVSTRASPSASTKSMNSRVIARYSLKQVAPRKMVASSSVPSYATRFMKSWEAWCDAFAAEVRDEMPQATTTQRRQETESRWCTFASKSLKCPEADLRAWLSTSSGRSIAY